MSRHQRRFDDVDFDLGGRSRSGGMGAIVLATVLGVGIGMLAGGARRGPQDEAAAPPPPERARGGTGGGARRDRGARWPSA